MNLTFQRAPGKSLGPLIPNQIGLQAGPDKAVDDPLDFPPIGTFVAEHDLVDGEAAVHLKVKNSLGLLKGQEAVGHEIGDIPFLVIIGQLVQESAGDGIIQKEQLVFFIVLYLIAEGIGAGGPVGTENVVKYTGGIAQNIR